MVSKLRVTLIMLLLAVIALGSIPLLVSMDAAAFLIRTVPLVILGLGATIASSLGLFNKKGS